MLNRIFGHDSYGGEGGIRTLDRVAPIPPFQDGALDQLCDPSSSAPLGLKN